jgi:hypothetical protein
MCRHLTSYLLIEVGRRLQAVLTEA